MAAFKAVYTQREREKRHEHGDGVRERKVIIK